MGNVEIPEVHGCPQCGRKVFYGLVYSLKRKTQTSGIKPELRIQTNKILKGMAERNYLSEN